MPWELYPFFPHATPIMRSKPSAKKTNNNIKITQIYNPQPRRKGAAATWYQKEQNLIFIQQRGYPAGRNSSVGRGGWAEVRDENRLHKHGIIGTRGNQFHELSVAVPWHRVHAGGISEGHQSVTREGRDGKWRKEEVEIEFHWGLFLQLEV